MEKVNYVFEVNSADTKTTSTALKGLLSCKTAQKMKFSIKDFFSKCDQMVAFTEEILNGKFHFC